MKILIMLFLIVCIYISSFSNSVFSIDISNQFVNVDLSQDFCKTLPVCNILPTFNNNPQKDITPTELYNKVSKYLVSINSDAGSGTGFVKGFHIITAYHVVKDAKNIQVKLFSDPHIYNASLSDVNRFLDIAELTISDPPILLQHYIQPPLEYAPSNTLHIGQQIMAIGNPQYGADFTPTIGVIGALHQDQPDLDDQGHIIGYLFNLIQHSAGTFHGNSGGPVFDMQGRVIGISDSGVPAFGSLNFAISTDEMNNMGTGLTNLGIHAENYIPAYNELFGINSTGGCIVTSMDQSSPAALSTLQNGTFKYRIYDKGADTGISSDADVIIEILGHPVNSCRDLFYIIDYYGNSHNITGIKKDGTVDMQIKDSMYPDGKTINIIASNSVLVKVLNGSISNPSNANWNNPSHISNTFPWSNKGFTFKLPSNNDLLKNRIAHDKFCEFYPSFSICNK
jgi:S1-C subfamily serine protease